MGRSRRSAAPRRRAAPSPSRSSAPAPARRPQAAPPAPQQSSGGGGGMMAGLASTVAQGMAFGTGSAIAHRAVGAVAGSIGGGSSEEEPQQQYAAAAPVEQQQQQQPVCFRDQKAFLDCLGESNNDIGACQFYFDAFNQCKQQQAFN